MTMSAPTIPTNAPTRSPRVRTVRRRTSLRRYRWTLENYHRAIDAGIFADDPRVELIKGELIRTVTMKPPHTTGLRKMAIALARTFPLTDTLIITQSPISLPPISEPEPDVAVVRGDVADYSERHPGPGDVLLVVEVSDATLTTDRSVKAPLYAEAGIAEYWILDLNARALEVYRNPVNGIYSTPTRHDETATILPLAAPPDAAPVAVADLLP